MPEHNAAEDLPHRQHPPKLLVPVADAEVDALRRLHALPPQALLTTIEAAVYLHVNADLLRAWRWQRRGPVFAGRGHFVRYAKHELDKFLAGHAGRVDAA